MFCKPVTVAALLFARTCKHKQKMPNSATHFAKSCQDGNFAKLINTLSISFKIIKKYIYIILKIKIYNRDFELSDVTFLCKNSINSVVS